MSKELEALKKRIDNLEKKLLEPVAQSIVNNMQDKYLKHFNNVASDSSKYMWDDSCVPVPKHDLHAGWAKKEKQEFLSFGDAMKKMKMGKFITRYMWRNPKIYCFLRDEELRVNTAMGKECPWTPNSVELLSEDWIVV